MSAILDTGTNILLLGSKTMQGILDLGLILTIPPRSLQHHAAPHTRTMVFHMSGCAAQSWVLALRQKI